MSEPVWLAQATVITIHDTLITLFGGAHGIRDEGLLQSALSRPQNVWAYEQGSLPRLAAAYGFGICRNHPFIDGNKRIALAAVALFLEKNGLQLVATETNAVINFLKLAAGEMTEVELADWISANVASLS